MSRLRLVALALTVAGLSPTGRAATPAELEAYQRLLDTARAHHDRGEATECASAYQAAYAMSGDPTLLFNAGVCLFDGGRDADARVALAQYLARAPASAGGRAEAERMLALLAQKPPADPLRVAAPANPTTGPPWWNGRRIAAVTTGAVGIVSLGAAVPFAVRSARLWNEARDACPGLSRCPDDEGSRLSGEARLHADVATGLVVGGGLLLAAAATLVIVDVVSSDDDDGGSDGPVVSIGAGWDTLRLTVGGSF